jgi:hypothetical protein
VVLRHLVGDAGVADLALGADDALLHGGLAREERAGHLGRREAAEQAQGQRDPRLRGQCRVAAGEEEPQAIVRNRAHVVGVVAGSGTTERLELTELVEIAALPPKPVDGAVAGSPDDPGAGIGREPVARPALQRDRERVLDGLLREVDVAEDPDQGRERPPRLAPEQAVDDRVRPRYADRAASPAGFGNPAAS